MEKKTKTYDGVLLMGAVMVGQPLVFQTRNPACTLQTSCVQKILANASDPKNGNSILIETKNTIYALTHVEQFYNR